MAKFRIVKHTYKFEGLDDVWYEGQIKRHFWSFWQPITGLRQSYNVVEWHVNEYKRKIERMMK